MLSGIKRSGFKLGFKLIRSTSPPFDVKNITTLFQSV